MNKKALALAITLSLSLTTTAFAAVSYRGEKLGNNVSPDFTAPAVSVSGLDKEEDVQAEKAIRKNKNKDAQIKEEVLTEEKRSKNEKKEKTEKVSQETLPITLYGDHVIYHQDTGDFTADGNVRVYQGKQELYTSKVEGNMKTGDVYLKTGGKLVEENTTTYGEWAHYNFNNKTGKILKMHGNSGPDLFKAEEGTIYPDKIDMGKGGTTTRCPAVEHAPCLEIKSDHVVMYPNDKIIAYNVKVYLKGKHIYSRDKYVNKLGEKNDNSVMPHLGYSSEHGWEVEYDYNLALSAKDQAAAHLKYYSKIGWRPLFDYTHDERNWYALVQNGHTEDNDNNWIKKQSDITIGYKAHKFTKKLPLNYSLYYNHGLWSDNYRKSWHTEYGVFLSHDRIYFDQKNTTFLDLGMGHKWTKESINDYTDKTMLYSGTLGKQFKYGWNSWLGYYWQRTRNNVFAYNEPDMAREVQWGVTKVFDPKNTLTYIMRYDEGQSSLYESTWSYMHDFCCWRLTVEYRDKKYNNDQEWRVNYDLYRW